MFIGTKEQEFLGNRVQKHLSIVKVKKIYCSTLFKGLIVSIKACFDACK